MTFESGRFAGALAETRVTVEATWPGRGRIILRANFALAFATMLGAGPAFAQASTSVLRAAEDAFGQRIGNEQIGLYSESGVRGFSLQNAGNFRLDGQYFVRAGDIPNAVVNGAAVQIGVSALRTDFPAPSGLVAFALKTPGETPSGLTIETGFRGHPSPFVQADGWFAPKNARASVTFGGATTPSTVYPDGTRGGEWSLGAVPRLSIGEIDVTGIVGWSRLHYNGDYAFESVDHDVPPPNLPRGYRLFSPPWARTVSISSILGVNAKRVSDNWRLSASAHLSRRRQAASDFTLLEVSPSGIADATVFLIRGQESDAVSAEFAGDRAFQFGAINSRTYATVRTRRSTSRSSGGESFPLGAVNLYDPRYPAAPTFSGAIHTAVNIDQKTLAVGDELKFADRLQAKIGLQRTFYRKTVRAAGQTERTDNAYWLLDSSLVVSLQGSWLAYSSFVKGLQEIGVAPNNAINRNEALPAVLATQVEVGLKGKVFDRLSVVAALFDISKPTAGFDQTSRYGVVGDIRHRGVEFSIAGEVVPGLSTSSGLVWFEPTISGEAVDRGLIGKRPLGLSSFRAQAGFDYAVPQIRGLSIDTQVNVEGQQRATDRYLVGAKTTADLGVRYRFSLKNRPVAVRGRISNLTDEHAWSGDSGFYRRDIGRTYTLSLEATLP